MNDDTQDGGTGRRVDADVARLHDDGLPPAARAGLDARLERLSRDIAPPETSWAAVRDRLEDRAPRLAPWRSFGLAASVAALAVMIGLSALRAPLPEGPASLAEAPPPAGATPALRSSPRAVPDAGRDRYRTAALPASLGGRDALGAGFLRARNEVSADFAARLETLDPATREVVERNLTVIHDALSRIEIALADDPNNVLLRDLLTSTWQRELDFMNRVRRLPAAPSDDGSIEL